MTVELAVIAESWPIAGKFTISRGSRISAEVVCVTLRDGLAVGRGEAVPYPRYGETVTEVVAQIEAHRSDLAAGLDRAALQDVMAAGAARNALDCALWDLEAKRSGRSVAARASLPEPQPVTTAYTISVGTPAAMATAAAKAAARPLLKVKLAGAGDPERLAAVRENAPRSALIVDANEAWSAAVFETNMQAAVDTGVLLVEQPLPADEDDVLSRVPRPIAVCADESAHVTADLARLVGRYDAVNLKLDKTGGLTEMLHMKAHARTLGFKVMIGCMVGTSLAMAPALLAAQDADFVDLDGPLLLARDRDTGLQFDGSRIFPPSRQLWG